MPTTESVTADPPAGSAAERRVILDHVRRSWRRTLGETECEEAVSEAYVVLLERIRNGDPPENRIGWLTNAARRIAHDAYRRNGRRATDREHQKLAEVADAAAGPEQQAELHDLDGRLKEAYNQLPKKLRLALASEFADGLTVKEICRRLRCRKSTLMHRRTKAREYLYAAATAENERFDDAVTAMMVACLGGAATSDQRRRVQELKARSPYYAARFAELRALDERLPAIIPPIAAADPIILDRAGSALGNLRDTAYGLISRSPETADTATSSALSSGAGKVGGATAGGLGGVLGLGGGAAKLAITCGGAAATAACVAAIAPGVDLPGLGSRQPAEKPADVEATRGLGPSHAMLPAQVGNPPSAATPSTELSPAHESSTESPGQEPAPTEPVAAEESSASDFSFGTGGTARESAATPAQATTASPSGDEGSTTSGGGGSPPEGGDFAFGSP